MPAGKRSPNTLSSIVSRASSSGNVLVSLSRRVLFRELAIVQNQANVGTGSLNQKVVYKRRMMIGGSEVIGNDVVDRVLALERKRVEIEPAVRVQRLQQHLTGRRP